MQPTLRRLILVLVVLAFGSSARGAGAQSGSGDTHLHTSVVSGVPQGVPYFCANPTVSSVAGGAWSNPATWSTRTVPGANDKVSVASGHTVVYDVESDARLQCVELRGSLSFRTDANTRMKVGDLMVLESGHLEVGTTAKPVAPDVVAEIIIADRPIDSALDPAQIGTGIESLGKVTLHGAVKTPTFVRLAAEALAGETTLVLEQPVSGWRAGDRIAIPDTRQLREHERLTNYVEQNEHIAIEEVSGNRIVLSLPLKYDHKGARDADGRLEFPPHIGNITRNVVVRSENPQGVRGHMIFISRAEVDLRYVEVREMGRTRMGVLDNTQFDASGQMVRFGTNQIGRYAIHFHHTFGARKTPANGYQFTLIGNAVDDAPKWGVTVHNSHYGLIQDNVVYRTRGAGIVTEDGTESFNVFDHNFALRSEGSGEFAPRSGYGGPGPDPGGEGAGFWFRGPNNYIRNNVAANADVFGYGLAAGSLGTVAIPKFKGADTSNKSEIVMLDTTDASVLEFANNEAYGAIQTGAAWGWNGTVASFRVWHPWRHGLTGTPTDRLTVEAATVRGDKSVLVNDAESPAGVWFADYASKRIVVRNANVQGMRTGVASPFFSRLQAPEPGRGDGTAIIENGFFRNYIGVVVATAYSASARQVAKNAVVRGATFGSLDVPASQAFPPGAISMNYRMAPNDSDRREPILVFDFNRKPGDNFKVYYSLEAPESVAPCHDTRPEIGGWVCR